MTRLQFYEKLKRGERLFGICVSHASPVWVELPVRLGLDFVFIDAEHFPFSEQEIAFLCRAHAGRGIAPFVRVPDVDGPYARRARLWGAWAVVAPYVETPEQAEALVASVKRDPLRGIRLRDWEQDGGFPGPVREFLERRNGSVAVVVNVESVPAVENLGRILEVKGVDAALIGPHDLSISLGAPERYETPEFQQAVDEVLAICRGKNVPVGIHVWWDLEQERRWLEQGVSFLIHSSDLMAVEAALARDLAELRGSS